MEPKTVSIVIGSCNRCRFLKLAIASVREELERSSLAGEIIVIDGGSTDGTLSWLLKQKDIITIVQHNRGEWRGKPIERRSWGYFMNLGFKCAQGKYVCMLSDDCLVVPGAIVNGHALFEQEIARGEKTGAVAFYWRNWPERGPYLVGTTLSGRIFVNHGLFLKRALEDVGFIDENTFSFYHADGDLCLKMWQMGYRCIDSPQSFIEHYSHANAAHRSSNVEAARLDWQNYLLKWEGIYYFPTDEQTGGRQERPYDDPFHTADRFRKAESVREKITRFLMCSKKDFIGV
jgi:glycosyltransferase involved in cell wall biosynthesis